MPKVPITSFQFGWNPHTKQGAIRLKLSTGQEVPVPVGTAEEFTAIAMVLNESPVSLITENGYIVTTDWDPVGGT
jgi:hypothetical protein